MAPTKVWRVMPGLWCMRCRVCGWVAGFRSFGAAVLHDGLSLPLSRGRAAGWDVS